MCSISNQYSLIGHKQSLFCALPMLPQAKVFIENFFRDFRALLGKEHVIQSFKLCDFDVSGFSG